MKKTALYEKHISLSAKMVPFAGYDMPVRYASELEEHHAVRNNVGMFDVSHMGEFMVKGPHALELIQKVSSNDAAVLTPGKVQYSCLPNADGGIVDDLLVYMESSESYMLVVNASNIHKDWDWIEQHNDVGAELENISDGTSLLAVQGPNAISTLQKLTATDLTSLSYYTFVHGKIGLFPAIISATGYTGSGGFEIYIENKYAPEVWDKIMEAGAEYDIKPAGLGSRDTLRLEMGFALYGNDIDDTTSPIEAGLGWITKFSKDFVNSENLKAQKASGTDKKLIGFVMEEKGIPRSGYDILDKSDQVIGQVSSGSMSPTLGFGIGLGYVKTEFSAKDTNFYIAVRKRKLKAKVTRPPFYKA